MVSVCMYSVVKDDTVYQTKAQLSQNEIHICHILQMLI